MSDEQKVATDTRLPLDSLIFSGIDTTKEPHFAIAEMARFFFRHSPNWIRWLENDNMFVFEGKAVGMRRRVLKNGGTGARYYCLEDIEKMAHALMGRGVIDSFQMNNVLLLLQIQGRMWGYLGGGASVKVYEDGKGRWRWHVQDEDGRVMAKSSGAFATDGEARRRAESTFVDLPVLVISKNGEFNVHPPNPETFGQEVVD